MAYSPQIRNLLIPPNRRNYLVLLLSPQTLLSSRPSLSQKPALCLDLDRRPAGPPSSRATTDNPRRRGEGHRQPRHRRLPPSFLPRPAPTTLPASQDSPSRFGHHVRRPELRSRGPPPRVQDISTTSWTVDPLQWNGGGRAAGRRRPEGSSAAAGERLGAWQRNDAEQSICMSIETFIANRRS
jgi:hypothetical protein